MENGISSGDTAAVGTDTFVALRPFAIRRSGDSTRKMIASPETLLAALNSLSRTADFQLLPSSLKNEG